MLFEVREGGEVHPVTRVDVAVQNLNNAVGVPENGLCEFPKVEVFDDKRRDGVWDVGLFQVCKVVDDHHVDVGEVPQCLCW